jgi:tetratricopeptide (TPR) repeat protein
MFSTKTVRKFTVIGVLLAVAIAPALWANDALNQGMSNYKSGKYAEAAAEFQTLVDSSPNYDFGYFMLGLSLFKMDRYPEAKVNIEKAIGLNADKFEYHNGLATVHFTQKDYPKAVAALKTAEPLAGTDVQRFALYSTRGRCYAEMGKWADAVDDLEKAKKIDSKKASVLVMLGRAYYKLGYFDKAVPVFAQAVKLMPNDTGSMHMLSESLINLGAESTSDSEKDEMYTRAGLYAEQFQKAEPSNFQAANLVGRAALGASDYPTAEQAFRRVLAQKSDYCYAMVNLGKTYIAQQRWTEAEEILNEAASCAPRMAVIYESLGYSLQKQARLNEAVTAYEKAYDLKPSESVRNAIEICKQNLDVKQYNANVAGEEAAQEAAELKAQAEYEEELRKNKEWEERRKKGD